MASEEQPERSYGDDSPPLFWVVHDKPYANGCITSQARTMSPQYLEFLQRNRERVEER